MEGLFYVGVFLIVCVALAALGVLVALWHYFKGGTVKKYITLVLAALMLYPSILFGNLALKSDFYFGKPIAIPLMMFLVVLLRVTWEQRRENHWFFAFLKFLLCILFLNALIGSYFGTLGIVLQIALLIWLTYDYSKNQLLAVPNRSNKVIVTNTVIIGMTAAILTSVLNFILSAIGQWHAYGMPDSISLLPLVIGWLVPLVVLIVTSFITVKELRRVP